MTEPRLKAHGSTPNCGKFALVGKRLGTGARHVYMAVVLVVNAVVFYVAAYLAGSVGVDGFLGALFGSLIVSACSTVADQLLEKN